MSADRPKMSLEQQKAKRTVLEYLSRRTEIRERLLGYAGLGIRAQCVEQSRTTGFSYERADEEAAGPRVSDPTFNAATRSDLMLELLAELDREETRLMTACNRLIGHPRVLFPNQIAQVVSRYTEDNLTRAVTSASSVMQRAMSHTIDVNTEPIPGLSADGVPGCESCSRLKVDGRPWWSDPTYSGGNPTDLSGALKQKLRLCEPCMRFAINQEPTRLPTVAELKHRNEHPRGHWPKQYATNRRAS